MTHSIVPRATIMDICARRDAALAHFEAAYDAFAAANETLKRAYDATLYRTARETRFSLTRYAETPAYMGAHELPDKSEYMDCARKSADRAAWSHLVDLTGLFSLMDKQAKDELSDALVRDPPEATPENVHATLEQFMIDADMIFKRGIANVFSKLDRRFRSHDGWKIGSRIILTRVFDDNGFWNYYSNERDAIVDVERVFAVLDGRTNDAQGNGKTPIAGSLIPAIEEARRGHWGARQTEVASDYALIRIYKNGNAHLWLTRDDLVEKVNRLLAEYYGEVLADGTDEGADEVLKDRKTTPAKRHGFYPSPDPVVAQVIEQARLRDAAGAGRLRILEPSAGTGQLAAAAARLGHAVDCVEIQGELAQGLRRQNLYDDVWNLDFLAMAPMPIYDIVLMNPPFDRERDIDHVTHALGFLKPGGRLVAVMSAGTEFRETKKAKAFRALVERLGGRQYDLPAGSFAESGTYCNTIIMSLCAAAAAPAGLAREAAQPFA